MALIACKFILGMARLVAVTIKKTRGFVKRRLFAQEFGIRFLLAACLWLLVTGSWLLAEPETNSLEPMTIGMRPVACNQKVVTL